MAGRVLRGGSWNNNPQNCRSANRNNNTPDNRNNNIGFRVVVSAGVHWRCLRWRVSPSGIPAFKDAGSVARRQSWSGS